jgi:hypothetical protein
MTAVELIERLSKIGASVTIDGEQVTVRFPEGYRQQVEGLGPEIRRLKGELLRALNDANRQTPLDGNERRLDGEQTGFLGVRAPVECPALPIGVKLLRYRPKAPPIALVPVSIVTDVDTFIRDHLRALGHRLKYPRTRAIASIPEILAQLAEVGVELALE